MTAKKVKVRVYSTPTCPWCFKAKDFLRDNHIEFEDIDVKEDHEAAQYMIEKSGQMGVPVIEIGDEMVIGFDEERMKALLKLK